VEGTRQQELFFGKNWGNGGFVFVGLMWFCEMFCWLGKRM